MSLYFTILWDLLKDRVRRKRKGRNFLIFWFTLFSLNFSLYPCNLSGIHALIRMFMTYYQQSLIESQSFCVYIFQFRIKLILYIYNYVQYYILLYIIYIILYYLLIYIYIHTHTYQFFQNLHFLNQIAKNLKSKYV